MKLYQHEQIGLSAILIIIGFFSIIYTNIEAKNFSPFFLPNQFDQDTQIMITTTTSRPSFSYFKTNKSSTITPIDLNRADSITLIAIKGVGGYTAGKILRYRKRLGGFFSPLQLLDLTWKNISIDSLLPHFVASANSIIKLDINELSFKEILKHPYLEFEDVCEISNAKRKYGAINIDTITKYQIIPPHKLKKIKYYFK